MRRSVLHISELVDEIRTFHRKRRRYPNRDDGPVNGRLDLTFCGMNQCLQKGHRGLLPGSSLPRFLDEHFGVRNRLAAPDFTESELLKWIDAEFKRSGKYPNCGSGKIVESPGDTWMAVDKALCAGRRGFPGGSSLAEFIAEHRGIRNRSRPPKLKPKVVRRWCVAHKKRTGSWPIRSSGSIPEAPEETWAAIDAAFVHGTRGLAGYGSLARFLKREFGIRNKKDLPNLSESRIVRWAKAWRRKTGKLPTHLSGPVPDASGETWGGVHKAAYRGRRGLAKSSLYQILRNHGLHR